jgi:hypothetical protein
MAEPKPKQDEAGSLLAEIDRARQRVAKVATLDARTEIRDNVYPLLHMIASSIGAVLVEHEQRFATAETAIAELATAEESMILPELAAVIDEVLGMGLDICVLAEQAAAGGAGWAAELPAKVTAYREAVEALRADLDDVTLVDDEDGDDAEAAEQEEPKHVADRAE